MNRTATITAALLCFVATVAFSDEPPPEKNARREAIRDAISAIKQKKVVDVLELADTEKVNFLDLYDRWDEVRWQYRERRRVLMEELAGAMRGAGSRPLGAVLDDVDAVDAESRTSEDRLRVEFRSLLSDEQYAKLLLFEQNFNRNLRRFIQEQQRWAPPAKP